MKPKLRQYIIEQEHRNDLVGSLARQMISDPSFTPDDDNLAFRFAFLEFEECGEWTRLDAVRKINSFQDLKDLLRKEPRISEIIKEGLSIKIQRGYTFAASFLELKKKFEKLVGAMAENYELSDSSYYDLMVRVVSTILPHDVYTAYDGETHSTYNLDV